MEINEDSDPAQRTDEERAEIAYVAKLMDKKFEELARKKGRSSGARCYGEDNPLIALQNIATDDLKVLITNAGSVYGNMTEAELNAALESKDKILVKKIAWQIQPKLEKCKKPILLKRYF